MLELNLEFSGRTTDTSFSPIVSNGDSRVRILSGVLAYIAVVKSTQSVKGLDRLSISVSQFRYIKLGFLRGQLHKQVLCF